MMSNGEIKVLLVDDDEEDIQLIRKVLGKIDHVKYKTEWHSTFEEAVKIILRGEHDVYLVDYHLGAETGLDLIKLALEKGCNEPIILMTGQGNRTIDLEAMKLGAADYLNKNEITPPLLERSIRYSIDRKKAEEKLREMSFRDVLTGLANRRYFDEVFERELGRCQREERPLSLILIDIDYFKPFNDNYGHLEGDRCLQAVSDVIGGCIKRPGDLVARYGGEEFAVILPETGRSGALEIAEEMRLTVQSLKIPHKGSTVTGCSDLTMSAGVAVMNSKEVSTSADLIRKADEALYKAKNEGRNQVVET